MTPVLLRQHDADQQHNQAEAHDAAAGEPFGIEQGLLRLCSKTMAATISTSRRQRPADPRRFKPPQSRPSDSTAHQRHAGRQQKEGDEILLLEHLLRSLGGSFSAMTQASDTSASPSSKVRPRHSSVCSSSVERGAPAEWPATSR
jgi:hypothetical protein